MKKSIEAVVVTRDAAFGKQIGAALAGVVGDVRMVAEDELLNRKAEQTTLVFLDARDGGSGMTELMARLHRSGNGLRILVVAQDKSAELVLASMRAGAADYLSYPLDSSEIAASARRIIAHTAMKDTQGRVTAVFSLKGGQGTTFMAINLVDHLYALTRETCLLADFNLYMGHALVGLDMRCGYTPFDLARDLDRVDDTLLFSSLGQHPRGFYVLGISDQIADASRITGDDINGMVGVLRRHLRHTILDLPHDFSAQALAGLDNADQIIIVVQQDVSSLKSAQLALQEFARLGYDEEKTVIVVNRYRDKNTLELQDIANALKRPVFATLSDDYNTATTTCDKGQPLDVAAHESRLNDDFARFAALLTGLSPRLGARQKWWQGLWPSAKGRSL